MVLVLRYKVAKSILNPFWPASGNFLRKTALVKKLLNYKYVLWFVINISCSCHQNFEFTHCYSYFATIIARKESDNLNVPGMFLVRDRGNLFKQKTFNLTHLSHSWPSILIFLSQEGNTHDRTFM